MYPSRLLVNVSYRFLRVSHLKRNWCVGLSDDLISKQTIHEQIHKKSTKKVALVDSRRCPYETTISLDATPAGE